MPTGAGDPRYAILPAPSANRVYAAAAFDLALAELAVINRYQLGDRLRDLSTATMGGVRYLTFATTDGGVLDATDLALVGGVSTTHAVFSVQGNGGDELLRPLCAGGTLDQWDDDLITIPRYAGRTNDQFTALLVNLAVATATPVTGRRLRVLDPVSGRGTTINQAIMYGHDAAGVDIDGRDIEAWATFFTTWLQEKRIKHSVDRLRLRKSRAIGAGAKITVSMWADKEAQRERDGQHVVMIADDTLSVVEHLGLRSVDVIAGDLPYGVAHGSRAGDRLTLSRRPADLVAEAFPVWREVLRPGGVMALAWNVRTMAHDRMAEAVASAGLEEVALPEGASFMHRVDRTITRDVVLARRP
jgi:SAM-dependent methyltransferase